MRKAMAATIAALPLLCLNGFAQDSYQDDEFICFTDDGIIREDRATYQVLFQQEVKWRPGDSRLPGSAEGNIKVGVMFLDGNDAQKNAVKKYAWMWIERSRAGIDWVFDNPAANQIRITFNGKYGSWSKLGRTALSITDKTEPTMSFATKNGRPPGRGAILHEFGHALGLAHEHPNPIKPFHFVKSEVVNDHLTSQWCTQVIDNVPIPMTPEDCEEKVDRFIINELPENHLCPGSEAFDRRSVMQYPIRRNWTEEHIEIQPNPDPSPADLKCINNTYPHQFPTPPTLPSPPSPPPPPSSRSQVQESYCFVDVDRGDYLNIRALPNTSSSSRVLDHLISGVTLLVEPATDSWGYTARYCYRVHGRNVWKPLRQPGYVSYQLLQCSQYSPRRCSSGPKSLSRAAGN